MLGELCPAGAARDAGGAFVAFNLLQNGGSAAGYLLACFAASTRDAPWVLALQAVALVACFAVPLRTDVGVAKPAPPVSGAP